MKVEATEVAVKPYECVQILLLIIENVIGDDAKIFSLNDDKLLY